jgi:hypothetical protein
MASFGLPTWVNSEMPGVQIPMEGKIRVVLRGRAAHMFRLPHRGRSRSHCEFSRETHGLRGARREVCRRPASSPSDTPFRSTVANEAYEPSFSMFESFVRISFLVGSIRRLRTARHGVRCVILLETPHRLSPKPFLCTPNCRYRAWRTRMPLSIRTWRFFSSLEPIFRSHIACLMHSLVR